MDDIISKMANSGPSTPASVAGKIMQLLSESGIQAHVWHLQTKSHAQHMALGNYYESIIGLVDSLIEDMQGIYSMRLSGSMDCKIDSSYGESKPAEYFKKLRASLETHYKNPHLQHGTLKNIMDEIIGLVAKTEYLLTLK
jgi:hypothetical protein